MSLVLLLLALLTIALSAYFMPTTSPSRKIIQEGADALPSAPEETQRKDTKTRIPISVNYHLTRQCNYSCGFCFHTATSSHVESLPNAQRAMLLLQQAGMRKINFAGGEPFLQPRFLGRLARYCKDTLRLESVSIVTNGSKVTSSWLAEYGAYIDIMAVSCDSFDEATNVKIGRGKGAHLQKFRELKEMCEGYGVMFKVNTVVNRYNWQEDMNAAIQAINPKRWKCFQVLIIEEENGGGANTLRDARRFRISDEEFRTFCERHERNGCFVPEGNDVMKSSYLLLDEYLCFLNKGVKGKTKSVLEVGVQEALGDVYWDEEGFRERGGVYDWSRKGDGGCGEGGCGGGENPELEF